MNIILFEHKKNKDNTKRFCNFVVRKILCVMFSVWEEKKMSDKKRAEGMQKYEWKENTKKIALFFYKTKIAWPVRGNL